MKTRRLCLTAAIANVLGILISIDLAHGVTTYTYTGNIYRSGTRFGFDNQQPPDGGYVIETMSVSGSFTLASPLAADFPFTNVTPNVLNFSFFDGRNEVTNLNAVNPSFEVGTNSTGNINFWHIIVHTNDVLTFRGQQEWRIPTVFDRADIIECVFAGINCTATNSDFAFNERSAGTWSVTSDGTPVVPLPGALPLFATGLGVLGLLGWRRKRKATAN
jgi:hypothetical protein